MEYIVVFAFLAIIGLKIFAIININNIKRSFIIASIAEFFYLSVGVFGFYALSASVLHIEYQLVFRILAILLLFEFLKRGDTLDRIKGIGFNFAGVVFGFAIFGSLGVSLITSKQLILNALSAEGYFYLGYLVVAINIIEAYYLVTVLERVVFASSKFLSFEIKNKIPVLLLSVFGILVFVWPKVYLIIPDVFYKIHPFSLGVSFDFSGISGLFSVLFLFIMSLVFLYSIDYINNRKVFYYSAFAVLTFALMEIPLNFKFENFYLFWELMTISSYLLIVHPRKDAALKAAKLYFVMCIGGAYFLQHAFSYFYAHSISSFVEINSISVDIAVLMLIGFGVKAGIVPLQAWLPAAHPEAPSSISAPLSGILTKAGIFGLILLIYFAGFKSQVFSYILLTLGVVTLFYGEIKILYENDLKKLLAYSTIGQIGEIVAVLSLMSVYALNASVYHVINHAVVKDLLFLSAGILILSAKSRKLADLQGIGKQHPWIAFPFGIGIFALSAFPPFGNFNSKFLMVYAAMNEHNYFLAFSLIIGAVIGFVGMLRVFRVVFLLNPSRTFEKVGGLKLYVTYFLALCAVLLGVFGNYVAEAINGAVYASVFEVVKMPDFLLSIPYSIIILSIGAFVVFFFTKTSKSAGFVSAFFAFAAFLEVLTHKFSYGIFFAALVLFMAVLNFVYAARYMDHSHKQYRFFANFLIMIIGILGVLLSKNIYSLFFYWEIMGGWALYLALVHEEDEYSVKEASKYLVYNYAGAGILMIGFGVLLGYGNSLDVFRSLDMNGIGVFAVVMLCIGFLAKAAQLPFRIDFQMHPKPAPTPISGYISAVMLKTGPIMLAFMFYSIAAVLAFSKLSSLHIVAHTAAVVGVLTIIMGASFGILTNSMKRLLIFLTVAEIGYIIAGISLVSSDGFAAGMLHLVNHMFFKDLLFLSAGAIFYKTGIDSLDELGGIARKMPITFFVFMVAVFSTAGVPLYSGFVSKWMIYHALMEKGYVFLAVLSLLGSIMILLVFVKFLHSAYFGKVEKRFLKVEGVGPFMAVPMIILAVFNLILGIFPSVMLYPIDMMLKEFGFKAVKYGVASVSIGHDTLNMANIAVYLVLAIFIGFVVLWYFGKKERKTHIFLSGVRDLSEKEIHLHSQNYYEPLIVLIKGVIRFIKAIFGLKGGYVER